MNAATRDDDPAHPNFDGIVFYATTDKAGVVATPANGQSKPPVSFLPLSIAVCAAADLSAVIERIRGADRGSYLADYLDVMLDDFTAAIEGCRPEESA